MNRLIKHAGKRALSVIGRLESIFDRTYLADDVPNNAKPVWQAFIKHLPDDLSVLEIGSREVTGPSSARETFRNHRYTGFDYYPGRNVDVVGDAHRLSSYFSERFDLVFSQACFEHFAMPWIVSQEIAKTLKVGGYLYIATHFSYATHERPWNFFQFSDMGLRVLFPEALGFECIAASMSDPIVGRVSALAHESIRYQPIRGLYCGSEYFGRKARDVEDFAWGRMEVTNLAGGTVYPAPRA
ncbi:MAG: methyltransferase domain-containing protein [Acidobacteriaceae bacterium]